MKENKNNEKVLGFIKANPGTKIEAIVTGTKVGDLMTRKALKELLAGGSIELSTDDGSYSICDTGVKEATKSAVTKKEDDDMGPKHAPGVIGTIWDPNMHLAL